MDITYYGRRIVTVEVTYVTKSGKKKTVTENVISGQWIGHSRYGWKNGTSRQKQNLIERVLFRYRHNGINVYDAKIVNIDTTRILWNYCGMTGDIYKR